jgi:thiamine-phosphate pyrophosphorylase
MKLIVISSSESVPNEHGIINSLFEAGMEVLHIHKPNFSKEEIEKFIQKISSEYQNKIVLHSDFPKFHSVKELEEYQGKYEYAFLSPIFDSISKAGYGSSLDLRKIKLILQKRKVHPGGEDLGGALIALGGIDEDKIEICQQLGFVGVAVLGAIWKNSDPVEKFKRLKNLCQRRDLVF